jgi:hypothetical protein
MRCPPGEQLREPPHYGTARMRRSRRYYIAKCVAEAREVTPGQIGFVLTGG